MNRIFKQIQVFLCHHGSALILAAAKLTSEGTYLAHRVGIVAIKEGEPGFGGIDREFCHSFLSAIRGRR